MDPLSLKLVSAFAVYHISLTTLCFYDQQVGDQFYESFVAVYDVGLSTLTRLGSFFNGLW
jgi:hypothetical protein